jgi:hypothetical protein
MKKKLFIVVAVIIALSLMLGCQAKQPGTATGKPGVKVADYSKLSPTEVYNKFSESLLKGDYETAWLLLSDDTKNQMAEGEKAMKDLEAAMGDLEKAAKDEEPTTDEDVKAADAAAAAGAAEEVKEEAKEEVKKEEVKEEKTEPGFSLFKQAMTEITANEDTKKEIQNQKVLKEEIAEDGNTATLEVEVKPVGETENEETVTNTVHLVKQENGWKLDMTK